MIYSWTDEDGMSVYTGSKAEAMRKARDVSGQGIVSYVSRYEKTDGMTGMTLAVHVLNIGVGPADTIAVYKNGRIRKVRAAIDYR